MTPPLPSIFGGFAPSWRKELHSEVWLMPPIYHRVWYWLRLTAQHETFLFPTHEEYGIWVLPGQRITSLQQIAEGVKWSEWGVERVPNKKTIRAVLGWLESREMVTVESNAKGTLITLINWSSYNNSNAEKVTDKSNSKETRSGHKEEGKELKPLKPLPTKTPPADSRLFSDWFCYAYQITQDRPYRFEGSKDGKVLMEMLKAVTWKELASMACHFLTDSDRFPKNKAPSISCLKAKINDYPPHINGKAEEFRAMGIIPPEGVQLEEWRPWQN